MSGRRIIVTGSSSGIGKSIARRLLRSGHAVIGMSRREMTAGEFESDRYVHETVDFSDLRSLGGALANLAREHDGVSGVVLCAGFGRFGNVEELSYADIGALVDVNLTAQLYVTRAFLPAMKRRGEGDLIFIGSESALSGGRRGSVYVASKSGLRGAAQALRQECSASGVRVGVINLGMARTPFYDEAEFTHGDDPMQYVEGDDVASVVALMMEMRAGTVIDEVSLTPLKSVIQRKGR